MTLNPLRLIRANDEAYFPVPLSHFPLMSIAAPRSKGIRSTDKSPPLRPGYAPLNGFDSSDFRLQILELLLGSVSVGDRHYTTRYQHRLRNFAHEKVMITSKCFDNLQRFKRGWPVFMTPAGSPFNCGKHV